MTTAVRWWGPGLVQDGDVLFERYAPGNDRSTPWMSFSVAKSVTSMLIGAAIRDGYIVSVDEPVANYLPRLRGTPYEASTIRNVLQMASGVAWNEDYNDPDSDVAKAGAANSGFCVKPAEKEVRPFSERGTVMGPIWGIR